MSAPPMPDHVAAWLAGETAPDFGVLATYVQHPDAELTPDDIEELLTQAFDNAETHRAGRRLSAEALAIHGLPEPPPVAAYLRGLSAQELRTARARAEHQWHAALRTADYRADKLDELASAADAATALDAVARWNIIDGKPRIPELLPPANPPPVAPGVPPAHVYAAVLDAVSTFLARADDVAAVPPRMLVISETGSRKTSITLTSLAGWIERRKEAHRAHRVAMVVPSHKLAGQVLKDAVNAGINAAIFEGRDRTCRDTEAVALAREAGAEVNAATCGSLRGGPCCPFRQWCEDEGYFANLHRAAHADLIILAHNFIIEELPRPLRHDLALAVIDEDFAALIDRQFDLGIGVIEAETVQRFPVLDDDGLSDMTATEDLQRTLHEPLIEAAKACIGDYLNVDAMRARGFTAISDAPKRMRDANWQRKQTVSMQPGMSIEARKQVARSAAVNAQLPAISALTHAVDAMLTKGEKAAGLVSVRLDMRRTGSHTVLTVRGQHKAAAWLTDLPVLMLNATGRIEDVRRVFPSAEVNEMPRGQWQHFTLHQIVGGFGRSTLARHPTRLDELRDMLKVMMFGREQGYVAVHKSQEAEFATLRGVATDHHGNLAGSNDHEDADIGFIIGGAFADVDDAVSKAAARGGGAVAIAKPVRTLRAALLNDASAVDIEPLAYENPAVDAVHRGIYDTSMVQGVGRLRPLQRSVLNPGIGYVFGNVQLPFPVASVRRWSDVRPTRLIRMIAGERVWLSATQMADFRSDLFETPKAAAAARERFAGSVENMREAARAIVRHDTRPWIELVFQLPGQGQRSTGVLVPACDEAAVREELEAKYGRLRFCTSRQFTPGREVIPTPGNLEINRGTGITSADADAPVPMTALLDPPAASWRVERPPDG